MDADHPATLGNYRIEGLIGRGGYATVYLAEDVRPALRRKVAVKVLHRALGADPVFRERFLRESSMVASLDHCPSIVPVYDAGEEADLLFIAMRYIEGSDLKQQVEERGPLPLPLVASVVAQVADALDVAHEAGLVHRDVKPGNILLSKDLKRGYLADFGITKALGADHHLTTTSGYLGTPFYSSPEQLESGPVGRGTDVYALGAVAFHALTGTPPFSGTTEAVMAGHLFKPVPSASSVRPDLPPGLDGVLRRAMAKEAGGRQRSAGELAGDIGGLDAPESAEAKDTTGPKAATSIWRCPACRVLNAASTHQCAACGVARP